MLSFFPTPYPDELLYSILARYHIRSGNTSTGGTLTDVFGDRTISAIIDLPANITTLVNNLPITSELTEEELIYKHTLFPFYAAFLSPSRAKKIIESMKGNNGGGIHMSAGIMGSTIKTPNYFQFCPECLREDLDKYGETYWHRMHQIPGALVCPTHKVPLQRSLIASSGVNKHEFFAADEKNCVIEYNKEVYPQDLIEKLYILSKDIETILNGNNERKEYEWFRKNYIYKIYKMGLATPTGVIVGHRDLMDGFRKFYGSEFLTLVQSDIDFTCEGNWIDSAIRKSGTAVHPLRHLLLCRYLGIPLEELRTVEYKYEPFGSGPWLCHNVAAEHYKQPVIETVDIRYNYDIKKIVGTFSCSCGFVYSRTEGDITDDCGKFGLVKVYGDVWEEKLKSLVDDESLSLRQIAKQLNVVNKTVKKYAEKLGLDLSSRTLNFRCEVEQFNNNSDAQIHQELSRDRYREQWLALRNLYPESTKTELHNMSERTYMWLYRHDREWLHSNSPTKKVVMNGNRVNWNKRDEDTLLMVRKTVEEMLSSNMRPEKICVCRIGRKLRIHPLLSKHIDKMPKTKTYLKSVVENDKNYHIRKIKWAVSELAKEGKIMRLSTVFRKAGIRYDYKDEYEDIIVDEIRKYL